MGTTIAVSGKGGTGKTTFTALLIKYLLNKKSGSILAIDADPNATLADNLGVSVDNTMVGIMDEMCKNLDKLPIGMAKEEYMNMQIQNSISENKGFDLVVMGRPEGPGCYCYANSVLRGLVTKLSKEYTYTVIDNEAGMEHLSRRTTRSIDKLFLISDYSLVGLRTTLRIDNLIKELDIKVKESYLIINRVTAGLEGLEEEIQKVKATFLGSIPYSPELLKLSIEGKPAVDLPAKNEILEAVNKICETAQL